MQVDESTRSSGGVVPLSAARPRPSATARLIERIQYVRRLFTALQALRDPQTPRWAKVVAVTALLYVVSPLDVVPDLAPVIGWIDDLGVAAMAVSALLSTTRRASLR